MIFQGRLITHALIKGNLVIVISKLKRRLIDMTGQKLVQYENQAPSVFKMFKKEETPTCRKDSACVSNK